MCRLIIETLITFTAEQPSWHMNHYLQYTEMTTLVDVKSLKQIIQHNDSLILSGLQTSIHTEHLNSVQMTLYYILLGRTSFRSMTIHLQLIFFLFLKITSCNGCHNLLYGVVLVVSSYLMLNIRFIFISHSQIILNPPVHSLEISYLVTWSTLSIEYTMPWLWQQLLASTAVAIQAQQ